MSSFLLTLVPVPGYLLWSHSAGNNLESVRGKTGLTKLPRATSPLPWRVIFNPGQFTH